VLATAMPPSPQGELFAANTALTRNMAVSSAQMPKPRRWNRNPSASTPSRPGPYAFPREIHKAPRIKIPRANWAPSPAAPDIRPNSIRARAMKRGAA
jgi:hypothetical protein